MRLIDADAAYKAACEGADNWDGGCSPYRDDCIREEMDKVPTASPWHRVEEPPKERDDYFAFTSDGEAKVCDYIPSVKQWWDGDYMILNVTHWMPIEPPKEGV